MGIDLRLIGAMMVIAYLAYVFIGQAVSPLASSRRRVRRLQLWYARSIALILVLSSLVSLVVPIDSLKDGVMLALTTGILPMAAVSVVFSALVIKRLYSRWRGRSVPETRRNEIVAPMSLAELHEQERRTRQTDATAPTGDFELDAELDELDQQLEDDLLQHQGQPVESTRAKLPISDEDRLAEQARQRRA